MAKLCDTAFQFIVSEKHVQYLLVKYKKLTLLYFFEKIHAVHDC